MLEVAEIHTYYAQSHVLHGLSLEVGENEVVSLLGRNGAGKTTTIRSIMGLTPPRKGSIKFQDEEIAGTHPYAIFRRGIKLVPQGRRIFPALTVEENLRLAMIKAKIGDRKGELEKVYERFPILRERRGQKGGHLSGGERQMLAIARALLGKTKLILLDEPTEGLAPVIIRAIKEMIIEIGRAGVAILLAEQNVRLALGVADRHYIIDKGTAKFTGTTPELRANQDIMKSYLGFSVG
ncbi:MAG: ABC transporter ATP-binding protein [Candidatus Bipolaricaulia bacterium]